MNEIIEQCLLLHAHMLSCYSPVPLFATLWTFTQQAPLSRGCLRQKYCLAFFLLNPPNKPMKQDTESIPQVWKLGLKEKLNNSSKAPQLTGAGLKPGQCNSKILIFPLVFPCLPSVLCLFSFLNSSLIRSDWQCCVSFKCTAEWFSYTYICMSCTSFFQILFYYRPSQVIECKSLCYTGGPCFPIL